MALTKLDKKWILEAMSTIVHLSEEGIKKYVDEKVAHLPTVEEMNSMRDEILTELRKVRTEQEFIRSKVYDDIEPRVKALEDIK